MINIRKELSKAEIKSNIFAKMKRGLRIIARFLCQHKNLAQDIVTIQLGGASDSLIRELIEEQGVENKAYTVRVKRVFCVDCGRIIYTTPLEDENHPKNQ